MQSILDNHNINRILTIAKENLERDSQLQSVLFLKIPAIDQIIITPVSFTSSETDYKEKYFMAVNMAIRQKYNCSIDEAVFIADTYFLQLKRNDDIKTRLPVHDQPDKREAIVICGRNKDKTVSFANTYPYIRVNNKVIFEQAIKHNSGTSSGLIDFLFEPELARKVKDAIFNSNHETLN